MESLNKSFKHWKTQEVKEVFGIQMLKKMPKLEAWLNNDCTITDDERKQLHFLRNHLSDKVDFWNEAASKFYFIGPLMSMINYDETGYNSFLEPSLSIQIDENTKVSGNIYFLVATGEQIPRAPFFTLHEYKAEAKGSNDPQGQLLIAMVAAGLQNEKVNIPQPIYGVYVLGRFWFFLILDGTTYAKSRAYDATQDDIFTIFCALKRVKEYIIESEK